ncbi:unnamed protein product [Phaedon cochleariae]|uniref:C2H2-type domain-containing protein n=1 Tax=Phaedon cochleariae TaxID=80249 RepID=A0A9P0DG29_PHACE|nr:unnamed protein product [Phaedon cochleariae]
MYKKNHINTITDLSIQENLPMMDILYTVNKKEDTFTIKDVDESISDPINMEINTMKSMFVNPEELEDHSNLSNPSSNPSDEIKLENDSKNFSLNSTDYKCEVCGEIFIKYAEFKVHRKNHYLEKRKCHICNITLQSIGKLQEHVYKHLGMKPFSCDECGKSFISKNHVKLHKRCHNKEKTFQCSKCDKAFRNSGSLRSHQLVHAEKVQEFICKVCNTDCKNLPDFRKHMVEHGKKSEIKCGVCGATFMSDRSLECHLHCHKDLKFPCEFCGNIYPSMYRVKRHVKRAHIPNRCEECNEVFYDRAQFTKHVKNHNLDKPVECNICQKKFDKGKNLSEHIRLQHKQDKEKQKCHICEKEFPNAALLKNHVKTHDKSFKCPDCHKVFSSRFNLKTHSITHSGERNHKCDICQKSFTTKGSLKNHKAVHSDERLFQCEQCAKTFKTNRRLYSHKFSHATEQKFQCEICLQKFRVKQYLKYHMTKHSTLKPFRCTICSKRFKHKKSYEKHMNSNKHKIREDEHDCDFCDDSFTTRDSLLDHFASVHHKENVINSLRDCEGIENSEDGLEPDADNFGDDGNSDEDIKPDLGGCGINLMAKDDVKEECSDENPELEYKVKVETDVAGYME